MRQIKHNNLTIVDYKVNKNGQSVQKSYVEHQGAVAIIAINEQNQIILTKQFRYPLNRTTLEIPAGKIENGESSIEAAKRELMEETGYRVEQMELIGSYETTPGFSNQVLDIYLAKSVYRQEEKVQFGVDIDEEIDLVTCTLEDFCELEISDFKTAYAKQVVYERYIN